MKNIAKTLNKKSKTVLELAGSRGPWVSSLIIPLSIQSKVKTIDVSDHLSHV